MDERDFQCDETLGSENLQTRFHLDKCEVLRVIQERDHRSYLSTNP